MPQVKMGWRTCAPSLIDNVVIRTLKFDQPGKILLLTTNIFEKANHSTIVELFDKSMFI